MSIQPPSPTATPAEFAAFWSALSKLNAHERALLRYQARKANRDRYFARKEKRA